MSVTEDLFHYGELKYELTPFLPEGISISRTEGVYDITPSTGETTRQEVVVGLYEKGTDRYNLKVIREHCQTGVP